MPAKPIASHLNVITDSNSYSIFITYKKDKEAKKKLTHVISSMEWPLGDSKQVVPGELKDGLAALVKKFEIPAKLNMRLNLSNPKYHASTNLEYGGYSKAEIQTMSDATDILAAIKKAAGEKAEVELVATKPPVGFQFKTNHFEVKKANAAQLIELISVTPTSGTAKVLGS